MRIQRIAAIVIVTVFVLGTIPTCCLAQGGPGHGARNFAKKGGKVPAPGMVRRGPGPQAGRGAGLGWGFIQGQWWRSPRAQERLGLTEEQIEKLTEKGSGFRGRVHEVIERELGAREALNDLLSSPELNESEIKDQADRVAELREKAVRLHAEHALTVSEALTPEQRGKIGQIQKRGRGRPGPGRPPAQRAKQAPGNWWGHPRVRKELGLTDEQTDALKSEAAGHREQVGDFQRKVQRFRTQLMRMITAKNPDREKIEAQVDDLSVKERSAIISQVEHRMKVASILTPEQREKTQRIGAFFAKRSRLHPAAPVGPQQRRRMEENRRTRAGRGLPGERKGEKNGIGDRLRKEKRIRMRDAVPESQPCEEEGAPEKPDCTEEKAKE